MNKEIFIYLDGKIYIIYLDEDKLKIRLKKPEEETTNKTCLLLHANKNIKKSGYIIVDKNKKISDVEILTEASKKLNTLDATTVYLLKTEIEDNYIYYYTTKYEIERLFLDLEFKNIYPLEFFLYNMDTTGELYGIISEDLCYIKRINSLMDLQGEGKSFIDKDEPISLNSVVANLSSPKNKYMLINNNIDHIINTHDEINRNKIGNDYIPFKERKNNFNSDENEIIDPLPLATNLKELKFEQLLNTLDKFKNFKFQDKVSTFYKAKKLKPFLLIISFIFIICSVYFIYQFINIQTINYIYSTKINNLKTEIKKVEKKKKIADNNDFLSYYKPIDKKQLNIIKNIINQLNMDKILKYTFKIQNQNIEMEIITTDLNNVKIINNMKNINNIVLKTKNNKYSIKFYYGKKKKLSHKRRRR